MEELRACFEPGLRCSSVAGQREGHVIATGVYRSKFVMVVHSVQCFCRCVVSRGVEAQSWSCCCSSAFAGILPQEMFFHMSPPFHYFLLDHEQNSHQCHMLYSAARKIDMIDLSHDCNSLSAHRYESYPAIVLLPPIKIYIVVKSRLKVAYLFQIQVPLCCFAEFRLSDVSAQQHWVVSFSAERMKG